jgi:hypothetical protein
VTLNGIPLETSDGCAVSGESRLTLESPAGAEVMLFDLA